MKHSGSLFYRKPTTLSAVRDAGVLLSEEPDGVAELRVICTLVPHANRIEWRTEFAVQILRKDDEWTDIMVHLSSGDALDANVERAETLFAATPGEKCEMTVLMMFRADAMRAAQSPPRARQTWKSAPGDDDRVSFFSARRLSQNEQDTALAGPPPIGACFAWMA